MGYPIRIYEFAPYMAGISQCGDIPDDVDRTRWELGPPEMRFLWTVNAIAESLQWLRCGAGQCGIDPHLEIEIFGDLECIFKRWKPAHTQIVWDYSAVDNAYALDDYWQAGLRSAARVAGSRRSRALHGSAATFPFVRRGPNTQWRAARRRRMAWHYSVGSPTLVMNPWGRMTVIEASDQARFLMTTPPILLLRTVGCYRGC